ncbi:MAG TPA: DUF4339 domain-containing protein [Verrucomicrobia bacterium]|nr:DUF4339 domain-containing protein [Verrucomicrobiota bacterium]
MRAGFRVFYRAEKARQTHRAMMIHISRDGDQFGPYSPEQVQEYLASGQLLPTDLAWYEGAADWVPVTEIAGGATAMPSMGVACSNCGAAMDANQVICLACGHNLDEPKLTEEEAAANLAEAIKHKPLEIPSPYTYEDETSDRSGAVNSIGWALITACLLPVFGGSEWNIAVVNFWKLPDWQMMFDILAPGVLGIVCIVLASASHGRARGVTLLVLMLIIFGVGFADEKAGTLKLEVPISTTPKVIASSSANEKGKGGNGDIIEESAAEPNKDEVAPGVPKATFEKRTKNIFYEKLNFNPGEHPTLVGLFMLGWVGVVFGAKARLYRPDSKLAWVIGMVGGVATILFWFMPSGSGMMLTTMTDALGDNLYLGIGLLLMFLLQIGAAVCCFINTRRIRPSLMKKYSNLAITCMVAGVMISLVPAWGKVMYDETKSHHAEAKARYDKVKASLPKAYIGTQTAQNEAKLALVEKPTNAIINSICGWMLTGVKYLAWLGGLLIVLPLSLVEILVGLREPDSAEFV